MMKLQGIYAGVFAAAISAQSVLADGGTILAEVQNHITAHKNDHAVLADLICEQARTHEYIFLGDTNHGSDAIKQAVNSPKVLTAIKDCMPSATLVLEGAPGTNEDLRLDALLFNKSLPEGNKGVFLRDYMVRQQFGVEGAYYDQGYALGREELAAARILWESYSENVECLPLRLIYNLKNSLVAPKQSLATLDTMLKNRTVNDNAPIAQSIKSNHADGVVAFYGSGHMDGDYDLDEMLPQSVTIDITDTSSAKDSAQPYMEKLMPKFYAVDGKNKGDFTYDAATQSYEVSAGQKQSTVASVISEQEFDACKAGIRPGIRGIFDKHRWDFTYQDYQVLVDMNQGLPQILQDWGSPAAP